MCVYNTGLVVGRFQMFHRGHEEIINKALAICENVVVCVGSSQESNTQKNPYAYELRYDILKTVYAPEISSRRLQVIPLPDANIGNNANWGTYVLKTVKEATGLIPNIAISGKEERRISWFDNSIADLYIAKILDISGTQLRDAMLEDKQGSWQPYVNPRLWGMYDILREKLLEAQNNTETASI